MLPISEVVNLSRLQFGLTAMYHFLFVPLTLGMSILIAIMESVYVMTGKRIWLYMTKYWGILFGINFAMGVATGITLEFQFGTNWSYYSYYVGDIFGAPLAIEGLMAFFLEATFIGLFFFGWQKLSKISHLLVTWLLALATNLSALWILIANGWMQYPTGAHFDIHTLRMEITSFFDLIFNPVAQAKFVHTVSAGYVTGAIFILSVSAYFLLKKRAIEFAKRSMAIAIAFGLPSALSVVVLGDESGYLAGENQKMKLASIEAMWETEEAPAALVVFGIPDTKNKTINYAIKIPYLLGIISTRSFNTKIPGINDLVKYNHTRIADGIRAYDALLQLKKDPTNVTLLNNFKASEKNLGYALLLKKYLLDVTQATQEQIAQAAKDTIPNVPILFWSFRIMVACGLFFIVLFSIGYWLLIKRKLTNKLFLKIALISLPLPWIAAELGWVVAEYGRQPWLIDGILPTFLGASNLKISDLFISLTFFILFYTVLAIIEFYLMIKYIRLGPDGLNLVSVNYTLTKNGVQLNA